MSVVNAPGAALVGSVFETAPAALLLSTAAGIVVACNPAGAALFGRMPDGMLGLQLTDLVERSSRAALRAALDAALESGARVRARALRPGGVSFEAEIHLARDRADSSLIALFVEDLGPRELARSAAAEAATWARMVEEYGFEAVVIHRDGAVVHANRAAADLLGYEPEEMVGRPVIGFAAPEAQAAVQREMQSRSERPYETIGQTRSGARLALEVRRRRIRLDGRPLTIVSFHDMSREIERRAALRASEERYRLLFERSMDGIFFTSPDGRIFDANPAACRMLGRSREEICRIGRERLQDRSDPRWQDALRTRSQSGSVVGEVRMRRKDGSSFTAEVTSSIFVDESGETRAGVIIRDATARREAEDRVRAALRAEHEARQQVDAMSAAKSEFLSTLSHEFRTGLTGIAWLMRPLSAPQSAPAERAALARQAHDEVERLLRLVDDILELDRMESRRLVLHREPVDLADLLESLAVLVRAGGRRVRVEVEPGLPSVDGDRDRLHQVFSNLLNNATKYSGPRSTIAVGARAGAGEVTAWVRNRGEPIPADRLNSIFERFVRVEHRRAAGPAGAGLGLAIVRELVQMHGGRVWATSSRSAGTTFHVSLPMAGGAARSRGRGAA